MAEIADQVDLEETTPDPGPGNLQAEAAPEQKKGRGRPRKTAPLPEADVIPRKPKGGDKPAEPKQAETAKTAEFYARLAEGAHMSISLMTGLDLTIPAKDAQALGEAIFQVVKEYDLTFISKYAPILNLMAVTAAVEIPVIIKAQAGLNAKQAKKAEAKQVVKPQQQGIEPGTPLKIVPQAGTGGVELGQAHFS